MIISYLYVFRIPISKFEYNIPLVLQLTLTFSRLNNTIAGTYKTRQKEDIYVLCHLFLHFQYIHSLFFLFPVLIKKSLSCSQQNQCMELQLPTPLEHQIQINDRIMFQQQSLEDLQMMDPFLFSVSNKKE
jgi:hypothetical protein